MKRLPDARIVPAREGHRSILSLWLKERMLDLALRDAGAGARPGRGHRGQERLRQAGAGASAGSGRRREVEAPKCGQIRLFRPFSKDTSERPRYVAVLERRSAESWLVAPFSIYGEPALPGEWRRSRRPPALRVLCLWNARVLSSHVLEMSWVVDGMSKAGITQAMAVYRHLAEGMVLPPHIARRVGPPLAHPADPRLDYIQEERAWISTLGGASGVSPRAISMWTTSDGGAHPRALAADRREPYRTPRERKPTGTRARRDPHAGKS